MTFDCPAAFLSSLESLEEFEVLGPIELPRAIIKDLLPLGHEISLWAAAAKNLTMRVSKDRLPNPLNTFLKHWLPDKHIEQPVKAFNLLLSQSAKGWEISGSSLPWMNDPTWSALLQLPALRSTWINDLRASHFDHLLRMIPSSWLMQSTLLPPGAVISGLDISGWSDLARFHKANRAFKIHSETKIFNLTHDQTNQEWHTNITHGIQSNRSILVEQSAKNSWILAHYEIQLPRISLSKAWHAENGIIRRVNHATKT